MQCLAWGLDTEGEKEMKNVEDKVEQHLWKYLFNLIDRSVSCHVGCSSKLTHRFRSDMIIIIA